MARDVIRTHKGEPPAERRRLFCIACFHQFVSGSLHCPSCLRYDALIEVEPGEDVLTDAEILKAKKQ